jgi:hypothetical protein
MYFSARLPVTAECHPDDFRGRLFYQRLYNDNDRFRACRQLKNGFDCLLGMDFSGNWTILNMTGHHNLLTYHLVC